jgi:hypothetical protein
VVTAGTWYAVRVEVRGSSINVSVDGRQILEATDTQIASGALKFVVYNGTHAQFDDIVVTR